MQQPTLHTPRVALRPAHPDDLEALHSLWSDLDVRRFLFDDRAIAREEAQEILDSCLELASRGIGLWLLVRQDGDAAAQSVVGCAGLLPVTEAAKYEPRIEGMIEPLVALQPSAWGQGYAVEALVVLQRYATETLAIPRLAGVTDVPNAASDRMLRRAGFKPFAETDGPRHRMRIYQWETGGDASPGDHR